jgi:hypothetical protein
MENKINLPAKEVSRLLDELNLPRRKEIDLLRNGILSASPGLTENWKWNNPNFHVDGKDLITMRTQPPPQIQLIFHRGAKVVAQPQRPIIEDPEKLLLWKSNDRAIMTFKNESDIQNAFSSLQNIVANWILAAEI